MVTTTNQQESTLQTEQEMMQYLQGDCQWGFSKLYDRFSAALFNLIQRWIKDKEVAENLLQDIFVKAWRSRDRYDMSKGRIFTWLYNIARNICIDHLRSKTFKKSKLSVLSDNMAEWQGERNSQTFLPDTIGVKELLNNLRQEEKQVIELMYFRGFTQKEIAEAMNIPLGTVKTRVSRAIKDLRFFYRQEWKQAMRLVSLN